jgi:hypothetical protein
MSAFQFGFRAGLRRCLVFTGSVNGFVLKLFVAELQFAFVLVIQRVFTVSFFRWQTTIGDELSSCKGLGFRV